MPGKAKFKQSDIPNDIRACFDAYGFKDDFTLASAVAIRFDEEWCGILFPDDEDGPFMAVDFVQRLKDGDLEWEISNDYVGPFESIKQFMTDPLGRYFF